MTFDFAAGYLAAMIDGEGSVILGTYPNGTLAQRSVGVYNTDYGIVEKVIECCEVLGLRHRERLGKPSKLGTKSCWRITIGGNRAQLEWMAKHLPLAHAGKRERLERAVTEYRHHRKPQCRELTKMYWDEKLSQQQIAERLGVTRGSVENWMHGYGIGARTKSDELTLSWKRRKRLVAAVGGDVSPLDFN